jgi:TRAP-type transport system periplasmic protein
MKIEKRFFVLALFCLALLAPHSAAAIELKIASIAPDGSVWMREMRKGAEEIKQRTEGRVTLRLYGGGVMGNERSVFRKIRAGQLHGGAFTSGGLGDVYSDMRIYGLPFLFRSLEEVDYIRARMDDTFRQGLENAGFVSFGFAEAGFANLMSVSPVRTTEDLKGQKVWVPEGDPVSYAVMEGLGLAPVSLPITDVLTGLQTGLIHIIGTSPMGAVAFQWHTRLKYTTDTPLLYLFATLIIDQRAFARLKPEDQGVVREVMGRIYREFDQQNRQENEAAGRALLRQGLTPLQIVPEEVQAWRENASRVLLRLSGQGVFSPGLWQEIEDHLRQFRQGGSALKQ